MSNQTIPHIVIVGGGAGGLELAAKLGHSLGKKKKAYITLIDSSPTHLWKPLLHEVAAGTLDSNEDQLNYFSYAAKHFFQFNLGTLQNLNRTNKKITLAPLHSSNNKMITSERTVSYDVLVIAIGSVANDFNTPGANEYCLFLDNTEQAKYFQQQFLDHMLHLSYQPIDSTPTFSLAIIGGGATGVEFAAELHYAIAEMRKNGLKINPSSIRLDVIEASDRLLPALSSKISEEATRVLNKLEIKVHTGKKVISISNNGLKLEDGEFIPANLIVWSAGIKASSLLAHLDGLATNKINQLMVKQTLQTTEDNSIFALGDCTSCPQPNSDKNVPPRAQAAHQQASFLAKNIPLFLNNQPLENYVYNDYGSLISLSRYQTVGSLVSIFSKQTSVEGYLAQFIYKSLYKMHQSALFGPWRVALLTLANRLSRSVRPRIKLH